MTKTAEAVTPKHPDKMCDQISDAVVDYCLAQDPMARVAIEVMGGHGHISVMGEVTIKDTDTLTDASARTMADLASNITKIAQRIGGENMQVAINIRRQSPEIAQGVDTGGAGDQGIMIGYACNDNDEMMPQEYYLARSLAKYLFAKWPVDGKTQVTIDHETKAMKTIVASFQGTTGEELRDAVLEWAKDKATDPGLVVQANPAGNWALGGFDADTGLTGRKIKVDAYGPEIPTGGGAFSGKDATKVDRSAAYMARKTAVVLLKERNAREVVVKLAYAIGVADPVMAVAIIDGVEEQLWPLELLRPQRIIETLDLRKPQFEETAKWGHFGIGALWDK